METSTTLPIDNSERNPTKIAALACGFIVLGLLAASLISASSARAGGTAIANVISSNR